MKRTLQILLAFILVFSTGFSDIQRPGDINTNAKIKAVFIFNFMKNIDWPSNYKSKKFTIGILGKNEPLFKELTKMSKVKKIANNSFTITNYKTVNEVTTPHILYVPYEMSSKLKEIVTKLKGKSTLIITEKPGLAEKGSAINFVVENNRQNFELNEKIIERNNLKVSTTLKNLAILVN